MKKYWLVTAALFAVDRITKLAVERELSGGQALVVWPGVLRFQYAQNTGVAFSMLEGKGWVVSAVTLLVLAAVLIFYIKDKSLTEVARAGISLILLGGLGNLIDRVVYGYVIDFIEVMFVRFAVFNVADIMVCVGAALAVIGFFMTKKEERDAVDG
ncbi:MAG: signal peptidase II [Clostridia bacterium]